MGLRNRDKFWDVVICGAGIAGISAAYALSVEGRPRKILLVDEQPPLSLTSDKSSECYRNWWPGPGSAMVALMNRSIDLLENLSEKFGAAFHLNRRGYLFVTGDPANIPVLRAEAEAISNQGAGPLRLHPGKALYTPAISTGYEDQPTGADLILEPALLHDHFPFLSDAAVAALHVRRAGWFSAQQFGMLLLSEARSRGVDLIHDRITAVETRANRVRAVRLEGAGQIQTPCFVNAAGPSLQAVGRMVGIDLPVFAELHLKAAIEDPLGVVPRDAPLLIWNDPLRLDWSPEERSLLAEENDLCWLLDPLPPGAHTRPEGGQGSRMLLLLWEYRPARMELAEPPTWPPPLDPQFPELALRGLATMIPGLRTYLGRIPRPQVDGGYYVKTPENRLLCGPTPVEGFFILGALSGYGLMAACAAGELLAAHILGNFLPLYSPAFALSRYTAPEYNRLLETWGETGQL